MPDSHVLPSRQAEAASTLDAAIGCQDDNDAADQRQEIEESLKGKKHRRKDRGYVQRHRCVERHHIRCTRRALSS
jgi:hypothetical protein